MIWTERRLARSGLVELDDETFTARTTMNLLGTDGPSTRPATSRRSSATSSRRTRWPARGILVVSRGRVHARAVPTLAVTLHDEPPRLLVNLEFIAEHAASEEDVRAVLLHEFLHVLLSHTGDVREDDRLTNLALDAVINHIMQRELGARIQRVLPPVLPPAGDATRSGCCARTRRATSRPETG